MLQRNGRRVADWFRGVVEELLGQEDHNGGDGDGVPEDVSPEHGLV